jgi:hypothetical protein
MSIIGLTMTSVTVTSMHEHMHERTSQQRKPNEQPEHMRPVLREQQRAGDDQKSDQHQAGLGFHGYAFSRFILMSKMILHRHRTVSINAWR